MLEKKSFVSIVIPCYNSERTILETLHSIADQTYKHYEVVIVNDGSSDNTERIISEYATLKTNISVFLQENGGQAKARNYGLTVAKGEYIVFVDADDKLHPDFLRECISAFNSDESVNMVYCEMQTFERENNVYNLREFKIEEFLITNCIPIFCMVRADHIKSIGGFDESMKNNEDWECWIRLYKKYGGKVIKINRILYYYRKRIDENSITDLSNKNQEISNTFYYVYNKHYDFYVEHNLSVYDLFRTYVQRGALNAKYYNIWYKKLYYKYFDKKRYIRMMNVYPFTDSK